MDEAAPGGIISFGYWVQQRRMALDLAILPLKDYNGYNAPLEGAFSFVKMPDKDQILYPVTI